MCYQSGKNEITAALCLIKETTVDREGHEKKLILISPLQERSATVVLIEI
jgi:hypothetical protein